jgi:hypothetical protein
LSGSCRFDFSVVCPFMSCIGSSIEACNVKSGRISLPKRVVGRSANPVVLSPRNFVNRRVDL